MTCVTVIKERVFLCVNGLAFWQGLGVTVVWGFEEGLEGGFAWVSGARPVLLY